MKTGSKFSRQANGQQTVNGDDYSFIFEKQAFFKSGFNVISLLSATVGLAVRTLANVMFSSLL